MLYTEIFIILLFIILICIVLYYARYCICCNPAENYIREGMDGDISINDLGMGDISIDDAGFMHELDFIDTLSEYDYSQYLEYLDSLDLLDTPSESGFYDYLYRPDFNEIIPQDLASLIIDDIDNKMAVGEITPYNPVLFFETDAVDLYFMKMDYLRENEFIQIEEGFTEEEERNIINKLEYADTRDPARWKSDNRFLYKPSNMNLIEINEFFESQFNENKEEIFNIVDIFIDIVQGGRKHSARDVFINVSKNLGIIAINITMAIFGLGPVASLISGLLKGEDNPEVLTNDSIRREIDESLKEQEYATTIHDLEVSVMQIKFDISHYVDYLYSTRSFPVNAEDSTIQRTDFNIVGFSYLDSEQVTKRKLLNETLQRITESFTTFRVEGHINVIIGNMVKHDLENGIIFYNIFRTVLILLKNVSIEKCLIDREPNIDDQGVKTYKNPFESKILGELQQHGFHHYGLINKLQENCVKFFHIINNLIQIYYDNLVYLVKCNDYSETHYRWVEHVDGISTAQFLKKQGHVGRLESSEYCTVALGPLKYQKTYYYQDKNKILKEEGHEEEQLEVSKDNAEIKDIHFPGEGGLINYKYNSLATFVDIMKFKKHYDMLKKIAGLTHTKHDNRYFDMNDEFGLPNYYLNAVLNSKKQGEDININVDNYKAMRDEINKILETHKDIISTEEGGYPFGINYPSYKQINTGLTGRKLENKEMEQSVLYCSPSRELTSMIYSDEYLMRDNKFMCSGNYFKECLEPYKSPGLVGTGTPLNRKIYCMNYDKKTNNSNDFNESVNKVKGRDIGNFFGITNIFRKLGITINQPYNNVMIELPRYNKGEINMREDEYTIFAEKPNIYIYNQSPQIFEYQEFKDIIFDQSFYSKKQNSLYYTCKSSSKGIQIDFIVDEKSLKYIGDQIIICNRYINIGRQMVKDKISEIPPQRALPPPPVREMTKDTQYEIGKLSSIMSAKRRELRALEVQLKSASNIQGIRIGAQIDILQNEISQINHRLKMIDPEYLGYLP